MNTDNKLAHALVELEQLKQAMKVFKKQIKRLEETVVELKETTVKVVKDL